MSCSWEGNRKCHIDLSSLYTYGVKSSVREMNPPLTLLMGYLFTYSRRALSDTAICVSVCLSVCPMYLAQQRFILWLWLYKLTENKQESKSHAQIEPSGQHGRMAIRNGRNGNETVAGAASKLFARWLHYPYGSRRPMPAGVYSYAARYIVLRATLC